MVYTINISVVSFLSYYGALPLKNRLWPFLFLFPIFCFAIVIVSLALSGIKRDVFSCVFGGLLWSCVTSSLGVKIIRV